MSYVIVAIVFSIIGYNAACFVHRYFRRKRLAQNKKRRGFSIPQQIRDNTHFKESFGKFFV